jgi:hypothetical protein
MPPMPAATCATALFHLRANRKIHVKVLGRASRAAQGLRGFAAGLVVAVEKSPLRRYVRRTRGRWLARCRKRRRSR